MSEVSSEHLNQELQQRVEKLFCGVDYNSVTSSDWLGGETEEDRDVDGKRPLLVWEREIIGRDIIRGLEVAAVDKLALLEKMAGELIVERWVLLETEKDNGQEDWFSMNMFTGQIFYEDEVYHETAVQEFESRFKIVEEI